MRPQFIIIQKKLHELYTIEPAEWYNSTANLARDLISAHDKCLRQFALAEVKSSISTTVTANRVDLDYNANKFKEIVVAIGYLKTEPLDFCSELLNKLKSGINLFKTNFPLIWSRHLLFRVYQLILLAANCSGHDQSQSAQCNQPLLSKDIIIGIGETKLLLQRRLKLKRLLETYEKLNAEFFRLPKHRLNVLAPQFSASKLAEVFNLAPQLQPQLQQSTFVKSAKSYDRLSHPSKSTSTLSVVATTTRIPLALVHIFYEYCWLHPLSQQDVELVEQSLLR